MDYQKQLCEAIDLMADEKEKEAKHIIHTCVQNLKKELPEEKTAKPDQLPKLYTWATCLELLEEYEQAILKYEAILKIKPDEEEALYKICQTLFYQLEKPEIAINIIQKKLLALNADKKEYRDLEADVLALLRHLKPEIKKDEDP